MPNDETVCFNCLEEVEIQDHGRGSFYKCEHCGFEQPEEVGNLQKDRIDIEELDRIHKIPIGSFICRECGSTCSDYEATEVPRIGIVCISCSFDLEFADEDDEGPRREF